jgi:hypothetical protein
VFEPGQRTNTGIRPDIQPASFLRDASPDVLRQYRVIYLLDVARLDEVAVKNLEEYVNGGGGLAMFLGGNVNTAFYNNRLYKEGTGLLPVPLEADDLLEPEVLENVPDVEASKHPIFESLLGEQNPLIRLVTIDRYYKVPQGWKPDEQSTAQIIASLRNYMPLVVEQKFGKGRIVTFLTTLAPQWNNWAPNPSFVVVLLNMHSFLAAEARSIDERIVGTPIEMQVEADKYRPEMTFMVPDANRRARVQVERTAAKLNEDSPFLIGAIGLAPSTTQTAGETDKSGLYEAWPTNREGAYEVKRFALNVVPEEGELALVDTQVLLTKLDSVKPVFRHAEELEYELAEQDGFNSSMFLMCLLVALLLAEQVMAYVCSYHPARGAIA